MLDSNQIFSDFLIRFSQISARSAPPPLRAAYPPLRDALTRERRPAKRNLHLASAQVNGRALLTMMRSLAGEGFRLGPDLHGFSGMAVRFGGAGRFRVSVSPNGMELPISLARGLPMKRFKV